MQVNNVNTNAAGHIINPARPVAGR